MTVKSADVVLASASPRRRELLGLLGVPFRVVVSQFDEESLGHLTDPIAYVTQAAAGKAEEVARRCDGLILGVDTDVVAPDGTILGKPTSDDDARRMLWSLSGKTHRVYSALCALHVVAGVTQARDTRLSNANVTFVPLTETAIDHYLRQGEHQDKAGSYGIQGHALSFVARIEGDLSCIIGLSLSDTLAILNKFNVPVGITSHFGNMSI